jgi:hypothetical protein
MSEPTTDRKVICLGMPSYGQCTDRAATGLYRPSKRAEYDIRIWGLSSSLATGNMNGLWCWALNTNHKTPVSYFVMQHTDIEPEEFWMDILIDELEAKGLDVLGVVAPIKDQRGVTSTAMDRPDKDTWRVHGRLTMKEIWRLPETFTSEDLGYPLLLNTGLWVCKFDEAWAKKVFFTVNDRISIDPKTGDYFAQIEPEDWFASRLYHELGLKVGCTRKVRLEHRGTMAFTNEIPWGSNDFDKEYLDRSVLDGRPPADWFPHKVAGWLSEDEGRELAELAAGKTVLEVGSYCGKSTICLAQRATSVGALDTFDGRGTAVPGDTLKLFETNLRRHGVRDKVQIYQGDSAELLPCLPPVYDLVFIDGSHDKESVLRDADLATATLKPGGLLAFHDYADKDKGVREAVDSLIASGAHLLRTVDSLAVIRPAAAASLAGV